MPKAIVSTWASNIETLDRVSDKFTARSLAGEYTLATTYGERRQIEGGLINTKAFKGIIVLNADRTFMAEVTLYSQSPSQQESITQLKATGNFNVDGNRLQLTPSTGLAVRDGKEEKITSEISEFIVSPNGQVLQQIGKSGIFLVKK
ncbi:hypothetical protein [Tumidithrix helvetica]|uniref:hypothetical protein n=1 Tax=Tumidithrix helvetica TaxID=3457545 RepID=UPI003CC64C44